MDIVPFLFPVAIAMIVLGFIWCGSSRHRAGCRAALIVFMVMFVVWASAKGLSFRSSRPIIGRSSGVQAPNLYDAMQSAPERRRPQRILSATTHPAGLTGTPWIDDWPTWFNTTHFQGFRAESSDTCATEAESYEEAVAYASEKLYQILTSRPDLFRRNGLNSQLIMDNARAAVVSNKLVLEQYVVPTNKSYGTLYKTYLLIDTSPSKMDPLVRQLNQQISVQARRQLTTFGSVAATVLVVLLLYAFLNTVTKGYFVWKLRAAVILVLIAAVLTVAAIG